jgi:hypothetical protein
VEPGAIVLETMVHAPGLHGYAGLAALGFAAGTRRVRRKFERAAGAFPGARESRWRQLRTTNVCTKYEKKMRPRVDYRSTPPPAAESKKENALEND